MCRALQQLRQQNWLPASSLPTESGSGNYLGHFYRLWAENNYLGSSAGADCAHHVFLFGDRKSLSTAKNHPKPSQEFREQIGPFLHKMKGFSKISHRKVHPKFAKNLGT